MGAMRVSVLLGVVGAVVAGGALWLSLARDLDWLRQVGLDFGGREPRDKGMDHDHDRGEPPDTTRRLASDQAPAPASDDALTPGNVIRERARESRTERLGDGTPTGPFTSPPVDPERT